MGFYHISPFELGQIKAHMEHGLGCGAIRDRVKKGDGKTLVTKEYLAQSAKNLSGTLKKHIGIE